MEREWYPISRVTRVDVQADIRRNQKLNLKKQGKQCVPDQLHCCKPTLSAKERHCRRVIGCRWVFSCSWEVFEVDGSGDSILVPTLFLSDIVMLWSMSQYGALHGFGLVRSTGDRLGVSGA